MAKRVPKKKSWLVDVSIAREILVLPMRLSAFDGKTLLENFNSTVLVGEDSPWVAASGWEGVNIGNRRVSAPGSYELDAERRNNFAEQAYFHPFIKSFLFAAGSEAPCQHFVRRPASLIKTLRVCASLGPKGLGSYEIDLEVERCLLTIIPEPGLALLTLEVAIAQDMDAKAKKPHIKRTHSILPDDRLTLADVLSLHDVVRRLYPPFFTKEGWLETIYPADVIINPNPGQHADKLRTQKLKDELLGGNHAAMAPWWREILGPMATTTVFTQVVDERIPSMMFVATPQEKYIGEADHIRLCFADGPGGDEPYAAEFMQGFRQKHAYARFSHWGTTYFSSSYAFTALLQMGEVSCDVLQEHFRRHYYRMFFIVQMQKAGLLMFSNWMSQAITSDQHYRKGIKQVREDFTKFTHRYWFSNVSNQEQARDLYQMMQSHAGNAELYEEVSRESETAREELDLMANQNEAENSFILNVLATVFTILALPLALGTPLAELPVFKDMKLNLLCASMAASSVVTFIVVYILYRRQNTFGMGSVPRWLTRVVLLALVALAAASVSIQKMPGSDELRLQVLRSWVPWI